MIRVNLLKGIQPKSLKGYFSLKEIKLAKAGLALARFVQERKFTDIILSGRSGPAIALPLFVTAWRHVANGSPLPKIHIFDQEGNRLLYQNLEDQTQRTRLLGEYIEKHLPDLLLARQNQVCFIEDMTITGEKYLAIRGIFSLEPHHPDRFCFTNLSFAFLCGTTISYLRPHDFVADPNIELTRFVYTLSRELQSPVVRKAIMRARQATNLPILTQTVPEARF